MVLDSGMLQNLLVNRLLVLPRTDISFGAPGKTPMEKPTKIVMLMFVMVSGIVDTMDTLLLSSTLTL